MCCWVVLGHEFLNFLDEVGLFCASFAGVVLTPVGQDLLQFADSQFLQVGVGQVNLLV